MNIVFLDSDTVGNKVNLSQFKDFGELTLFGTTNPDEISQRVKGQDIIIANKVLLNEKSLKDADKLKLICICATGTNNVDMDYAKSRNIAVTNVAGYSTDSVVQHTFAMLFYLNEQLSYYDNYVKSGLYAKSPVFSHIDRPFRIIKGKTWGIIGMGTIGKEVARIAEVFGCKVIYYSSSGRNTDQPYPLKKLDELLAESDIVSIHCPLTDNTKNLITYEKLSIMKPDSIILNLGRGSIINEHDLAQILNEKKIGGAGLDVLENEPINETNPLLSVNNPDHLFISPHIAWAALESLNTLMHEIYLNIKAFLNDEKRNRVV